MPIEYSSSTIYSVAMVTVAVGVVGVVVRGLSGMRCELS